MYETSAILNVGGHEVYTLRDNLHNLTGTYVVADKPVTVISGNSASHGIPQGSRWPSCEAPPPVSRLGMVHIIPAFPHRAKTTGYLGHVVAAYDNTQVIIPPGDTSEVLQRGEEKFIFRNSPYPTTVACSQRCLVMLYSKDHGADEIETSHFMTLVPSISQTITSGWFDTFHGPYV